MTVPPGWPSKYMSLFQVVRKLLKVNRLSLEEETVSPPTPLEVPFALRLVSSAAIS